MQRRQVAGGGFRVRDRAREVDDADRGDRPAGDEERDRDRADLVLRRPVALVRGIAAAAGLGQQVVDEARIAGEPARVLRGFFGEMATFMINRPV